MRLTHRFSIRGNISHNPVFRWLACGSGLNSAGMQGEQVVLGLLVYQLTQSSAWVGISLALFFAPMLIVGVPAGALADRFDRRSVLIKTEIALFASLAVFAVLLVMGLAGLSAALLMSVLSGVLRSLHHPARLSYTGDIAGNSGMVAALSLLSIVTRFGQLLGALAAGLVSQHYGPGSAYAVLALGHLVALWCFVRTHGNKTISHAVKHDQPETVTGAIVEYLKLLKSSSTLMLLIVFASLIEVFGFSFATALPQIAVERLALDAGGLGLMHAARAAGGLLGAY